MENKAGSSGAQDSTVKYGNVHCAERNVCMCHVPTVSDSCQARDKAQRESESPGCCFGVPLCWLSCLVSLGQCLASLSGKVVMAW